MSYRVSVAEHFHDRTKYHPDTLANAAGSMSDPPPEVFKTYRVGTEIDLKPYLEEARVSPQASQNERLWARLSHFLINVYGLTARVQMTSGQSFYLRSAPSAGGLYPAEIYLVSRGTALLPAGLYNYQVRTHSLWRYWEDHVWQPLKEACFWHPVLEQTHLAIAISTIFQRSAWRYRDRAYRRICLDTGHVLGNLDLASALVDYRPHLIGGFADHQLNQLLYLDETNEGVMAVAALSDLLDVDQNLPRVTTTQATHQHQPLPPAHEPDLLRCLHQATCIEAQQDCQWQVRPTVTVDSTATLQKPLRNDKYNFPFCLKVSTSTDPIDWDNQLQDLSKAILRRRSTRRFSGDALTLEELSTVLDFTYQPHHYLDQGLDSDPDYFDLELVQTFVAVSGVHGLEPGCYYYAPQAQELRQIRFKNFRSELHHLCLGQELGRDAGAVIFHTADLKQAIARYGDRAYRYLHLDAGHLGQRLNIAATHLGLGVSGIGGFFDDQVNDVLGIPAEEAVLYITALGRPA